ncbi:Os02g0324100 [Oryza sativa Japonica Group]|uniref:Uncharacterized protein n=2 Tax=Oryza sativa subsp. japonica TaxID=39947 RepID=A3A676_ORYSJ|nr:hypothetical protein OsJ_06491 [Oryza sativa Japonica Group]BAD15961.1 hypothetical protein [Oryza sativa Japonica Group]BAS78396.1 Os02g0324100 [Oryza sativa Japonica Group]
MAMGGGGPAVGSEAPVVAPKPRGWRMAVGSIGGGGISPPVARGGRRGERERGRRSAGGGLTGAVDAFRPAGEAGRQHAGAAAAAEAEARCETADRARERRHGIGRKEDEEVFRVGFIARILN